MEPLLEHERLDVYRLAVELHRSALAIVPRRGARVLRSQVERAALGVVLNIAEGAGRRSRPDKQRFYEIARGSATEVAAILDIALACSLASPNAYAHARLLAVRVVQILTKLAGPIR